MQLLLVRMLGRPSILMMSRDISSKCILILFTHVLYPALQSLQDQCNDILYTKYQFLQAQGLQTLACQLQGELKRAQGCLVGTVWSPNFSKFNDIDTKTQHVQICQKKLKECQTLGKKRTSEQDIFIFSYNVLLLSKELKNAIKIESANIFSPSNCLVCSTYRDSPKLDDTTNDECQQNFTTSCQHHMSKTRLQLSQLSKTLATLIENFNTMEVTIGGTDGGNP